MMTVTFDDSTWKLVPLEPTPAMAKANADGWLDCGSRLFLNKAKDGLRRAIAAAPSAADHMAGKTEDTCRKCGGRMKPSKAIEQTYVGSPDFPGHEAVTLRPGGSGNHIDCMKCSACGWSVTGGGE